MKHTHAGAILSHELLRFVRDQGPTVSEFLTRYGGQTFHLLRRGGAVVIERDRLRLSRRHLSPDGTRFVWGVAVWRLDDGLVEIVRWGPGGSAVYCDDA